MVVTGILGVIWFICSCSPSIDQIYVLKRVLHYQIYDEASIKTRLKIRRPLS
jgi:hypothetical protein